jgi:RNA polymerase sigma factor (sigma-70 family)
MRTDAELVEMARRGDAGARDELVRRYQRQTALLAGTLVGDLAEGEDLGQEAFVRAFRNLDLLVDPSRFGPWLRRIAFGVSIDWLRSFRPDLYRGWDEQAAPVAAPDPSPLDRLLGAEMAGRVARALAALPPRYRAPIRMFHLDGLSHARVADALGLPVGTVRSLVTRARHKLAVLLADHAPEALPQIHELFQEQTMSDSPRRFLHVANGDCTTDIIRAAGIPGTLSVWADVLHEGPVPAGLSDDELVAVRARFLHEETPWGPTLDDVLAHLRSWRAAVDGRAGCDEMILWYEHDLFDQLNLIQVLDRLREVEVAGAAPVSLICIGSFPGRPDFKGLGQLTPDELASLLETRQPLSSEQLELGSRAWRAFRAPDPRELEALLDAGTAALPFLAAALRRHLEEYPWTTDGLSRTERRILELARQPIDTWDAFGRVSEGETAFYIADGSFLNVVEAAAAVGLLSVTFPPRTRPALPRGAIELTDTGRAVLDGELDRVAHVGIDRWLGGVHLHGRGPTWRWNPASERLERA